MKISKDSRNNPLFLRNEFPYVGEEEFARINKQSIDLDNIKLLPYSDTRSNESEQYKSYGVHFFVDDYRFEGVYRNPEKSLNKLSQYSFIITPDYSLYREMPSWRQTESVGHSRWLGAYWQSKGLTVIPSVSWSNYISFSFFTSIEKGSIVAISTNGNKKSPTSFLRGYNKMLEVVEPSAIICLGKPFIGMEGNLLPINYSSKARRDRDGR